MPLPGPAWAQWHGSNGRQVERPDDSQQRRQQHGSGSSCLGRLFARAAPHKQMAQMTMLLLCCCAASSAWIAAAAALTETCAGWPLPNGFGVAPRAMGAPPPPPHVGPLKPWATVGNHRIEVRVSEMPQAGGTAVRVRLPWARHDAAPERTGIVVISAATSLALPNCSRLSASAEEAEIVFAASEGPGLYHVYYLPFTTCEYGACEYGASVDYNISNQPISCAVDPQAQAGWLRAEGGLRRVGSATAERMQSRTAFDAFGEMELAATAAQTQALVKHAAPDGVLLVTEQRHRPVRMRYHLPQLWASRPPASLGALRATAQPGEHFNFQVVLFPTKANLTVDSAHFEGELTQLAPVCMNLNGTDYWGRPYTPPPDATHIARGEVRSFFIATKIPVTAPDGHCFNGTVVIVAGDAQYRAAVSIVTRGATLINGGDDDIWREGRLQWLNSKLGLGTETSLPPPFKPLQLVTSGDHHSGQTVLALGKRVTVGSDGMLQSVLVSSDPQAPGRSVAALASSTRVELTVAGEVQPLTVSTAAMPHLDSARRQASWLSNLHAAANLKVQVQASFDFSGYADYVITVKNSATIPLRDFSFKLILPMAPNNTHFALGLSRPGGLLSTWFDQSSGCCCGTPRCDSTCTLDALRECPQRSINGSAPSCCPPTGSSTVTQWKWDGVNGDNALWLGSTKAGIRLFPKGDEDLWQAGVPFDGRSTPPNPESWSNGGKGGVRVHANGTAECFTGLRDVPAGHELTFRFSLMVTPTRPLNLSKHFDERYFQAGGPVDYKAVAAGGATVLNMHQGNVVNPWINYPYATNQLMKDAADSCHAFGMKFKIYNTMRELSNRCRELWAMRAFQETYVKGPDPNPDASDWLQEHLGGDFEKAWSNPMQTPFDKSVDLWWSQEQDAAIKVKALSRWNNYYVEGTRQMQRDFDYDGIYLDEIAYDRVTIMRTKAVLGDSKLIDHHCDIGDMGGNSCAANYMEMYPFIDTLWYGEGFNYDDASADYWLMEISGLAFGLPSDMLRYSGMTPMHIRGLAHGSSNRWQAISHNAGCTDNVSVTCDPFDPRDIWSLQRKFGIGQARMVGWWEELELGAASLPVRSSVAAVKVTTYVRRGRAALIVLANFGNVTTTCALDIDWRMLGLTASSSTLRAPALRVPPQRELEVSLSPSDRPEVEVPASVKGEPSSREGTILLLESSGHQ